MTKSEDKIDSGRLSVPWSALSLALGVVAIASLGALVIVATVKDVDVLSTVALALAILAFAAQIIVSLAQSQASAQQLAASERVNAETRGLLAQIGAQGASLLANQSGQFDRVLEAALGTESVRSAVHAASPEDEGNNPNELTGVDAEALSTALRRSVRGRFAGEPTDHVVNPYEDFVRELSTWPGQKESEKAVEILRELKPWEAALLARRAQADLRRAKLGLEPMGWSVVQAESFPSTKGLVDRGLLEFTPGIWPPDGSPALERRLTPLGKSVARLLNVGELANFPDWLREVLRAA